MGNDDADAARTSARALHRDFSARAGMFNTQENEGRAANGIGSTKGYCGSLLDPVQQPIYDR